MCWKDPSAKPHWESDHPSGSAAGEGILYYIYIYIYIYIERER